ncbi:hypothetical protein ElyMa_001765800 [Elysia marginata]|uniref:ShKT domain-containing protein n=1 Tax=Elysia marginata TaxID=1093978 RepID=A0AAV4ED79_9GAST|nr:hypothetical protein ElyMa_001765800 [Elysia marginata]
MRLADSECYRNPSLQAKVKNITPSCRKAYCGNCHQKCTDIPNLRAYGNCQAQRATELCGADLGAVYRAANDAYVMYCPEVRTLNNHLKLVKLIKTFRKSRISRASGTGNDSQVSQILQRFNNDFN